MSDSSTEATPVQDEVREYTNEELRERLEATQAEQSRRSQLAMMPVNIRNSIRAYLQQGGDFDSLELDQVTAEDSFEPLPGMSV